MIGATNQATYSKQYREYIQNYEILRLSAIITAITLPVLLVAGTLFLGAPFACCAIIPVAFGCILCYDLFVVADNRIKILQGCLSTVKFIAQGLFAGTDSSFNGTIILGRIVQLFAR